MSFAVICLYSVGQTSVDHLWHAIDSPREKHSKYVGAKFSCMSCHSGEIFAIYLDVPQP